MPPALGRNTDFMVRPDSVVKAKRVLGKFGIEYHVSALDMKRYENMIRHIKYTVSIS